MDELNAAKSRRMLLVEQTAATGGRMKAGKVSRTDEMRMTSLLDSMKDESARVSDEITQLEQRIHKLKTTGVDPYQCNSYQQPTTVLLIHLCLMILCVCR